MDHDQQRRQLLQRSFPLFAEHGFRGLSIRKLAEGLGVTTGAFYHYFRSKEQIFEAMMQMLMSEDAEEKMAFLQSSVGVGAKMRALGRAFAEQQGHLRLQTALCSEYCRHLQEQNRSTQEFWNLVKPRYRALCRQILGSDDDLAFELMSTFIQGILTRISWGDEPIALEELFGEFAAVMDRGRDRT